MNGRQFARQRALILASGRRPSDQRNAINRLAREAGAVPITIKGKLVGHMLPGGFMVCEKRRYATEALALDELQGVRQFKHLNPRDRLPIRAYHCDFCQGWHLTGQLKKA